MVNVCMRQVVSGQIGREADAWQQTTSYHKWVRADDVLIQMDVKWTSMDSCVLS